MVKYLSRYACLALVLATCLLATVNTSKVPVPTCNSPKIALQDWPIALHQTQQFNLDMFFSGYNVKLSIPSKPDFVQLRPKIQQTAIVNKSMPGLWSYHYAHQGNRWGNVLVTIRRENNKTIVNWGVSDTTHLIPDLSNEATVENDSSVHCYDAVWLRIENIILVDCVQNSSTLGIGLVNYFYYINASNKATIGKVKNDMYVAYTNIYHRKISLLTEDGYHYLIRAYLAEFVDEIHRRNTYVEIISLSNPMKPWTIRVMDRSFLHQESLAITDFQVYLGDIYILDYHSGVIKFDITPQQTIVIVGRYRTDSGFTKMGVYSNNLDNEFLLVLAHNHSIIEVDWSNQIKPTILTKYSVPDNAWIVDMWVNQQFVSTQIIANLTDSTGASKQYHSTYILGRGARTYLNAYVALAHPSRASFIDQDRQSGALLTIDTEGLKLYHLASPLLVVNPVQENLLNKQFSFVVKGESSNEYDPDHTLVCTFTFKYMVVPLDSYVLWPTGLTLPKDYYANYPGELFIPLDRYVFGPNITWGVKSSDASDAPTNYVLQQNDTLITWWDKPPTVNTYTFIRTEQFDSLDDTQINLYTQDSENTTHFTRCATIPYTTEVHCFESNHHPHINYKISNLTVNRYHYYQGVYIHLAAIVYQAIPNEVFLYHVEEDADNRIPPIMFPEGYEGKIQNIEFLGHYLVVVLRYTKEIVIYDMIKCEDFLPSPCKESYRINSTMMTKLGVNYFSPMDVYVSDFHPFVLFVQCLDKVVILDMTRQGPILLSEVVSPASQEPGFYKWKMAIARGQLILVNPPDRIEEHDLDQLYTRRDVPLTKVWPVYNYTIPDNFDLDFSDKGNLVYITAFDKNLDKDHNTVILVYRSDLNAVSSFYDVFHLGIARDDLMIDATGSFGDYITCAYHNKLFMFRQYEIPILVFEDVFGDYAFNITFTNDPQSRYYYLTRSTLHTANYPEDIVINNTQLNQSDFLKAEVDKENTEKFYPLDDNGWFNGSVLNYTLEGCSQCNKKIQVLNHVQQERVLLGVHDMEDYAFSLDGGYIQQFQSIIRMRHNGSIHEFVNLPSALDGEECKFIEHNFFYDFTVSACKNDQNGGEVYLYTTVYTASKPFVSGPYYSSAKHVTSLHSMGELLMVVDVDENPYSFDREGGIIIYAMNHDPYDWEIFDELEFIDSDDLQAANDWPGGQVFIGNAHFAFTNETNTYRLVITELRNGLFVVDFAYTKGRKSLEILKVEFINLKEELVNLHLPLPNLAFFTAVTVSNEYYDKTFGYWQTEVIVVTSNFHNFQIDLHIDKTGTVVSHNIPKVYYRYGFYQNENYIKAFDGYFAVGQRLPTLMHIFPWYSKLVLTVYDTRERWVFNKQTGQEEKVQHFLPNSTIPVNYMLGGYTMREGTVKFDWNFTLTRNRTDPFRRIGLLALHNYDARIWELSVHEQFGIHTYGGIENNQEGFLVARNDYHNVKIPINLIVNGSESGMPGWAIALIVIGCVLVAGGIGFVVYVKAVKKPAYRESETEKSLLEREGELDQKDEDEDSEGSSSGSGSGSEGSGEQIKAEGNEPEALQNEVEPPRAQDASINRETVTSVAQEEKPQQPEEEPQPEAQAENEAGEAGEVEEGEGQEKGQAEGEGQGENKE